MIRSILAYPFLAMLIVAGTSGREVVTPAEALRRLQETGLLEQVEVTSGLYIENLFDEEGMIIERVEVAGGLYIENLSTGEEGLVTIEDVRVNGDLVINGLGAKTLQLGGVGVVDGHLKLTRINVNNLQIVMTAIDNTLEMRDCPERFRIALRFQKPPKWIDVDSLALAQRVFYALPDKNISIRIADYDD